MPPGANRATVARSASSTVDPPLTGVNGLYGAPGVRSPAMGERT